MDGDSSRLIKDQKIFIFVKDGLCQIEQILITSADPGLRPSKRGYTNPIIQGESDEWPHSTTINPHLPISHDPIDMSSRNTLEVLEQVIIEALP
jgi:hypothetical protein